MVTLLLLPGSRIGLRISAFKSVDWPCLRLQAKRTRSCGRHKCVPPRGKVAVRVRRLLSVVVGRVSGYRGSVFRWLSAWFACGCTRSSPVLTTNRKTLNNNDHNQVFWARETEHPQQTIVLTKTAGQQPTNTPYSKMADILVFFCFPANWPFWPRFQT